MKLKSYPVGEGNHENIHFIVRHDLFIFKLCAFTLSQKIYIMSSTSKYDKRLYDKDFIYLAIISELKDKWDYDLVLNDVKDLFELRFENTKALMQSNYYLNSL